VSALHNILHAKEEIFLNSWLVTDTTEYPVRWYSWLQLGNLFTDSEKPLTNTKESYGNYSYEFGRCLSFLFFLNTTYDVKIRKVEKRVGYFSYKVW